MFSVNNPITTPAVYDISPTGMARKLRVSINKLTLQMASARHTGKNYIIRGEDKKEILAANVSHALSDIVANMALLYIDRSEGDKAIYFGDNILPVIEELGLANIERLVELNILPDGENEKGSDEDRIDYKDLLTAACAMYTEIVRATGSQAQLEVSTKFNGQLPRFTREMKIIASQMSFDIKSKLALPEAVINSNEDFKRLLEIIGEIYAINTNISKYDTLHVVKDEETLINKQTLAKDLTLKIGVLKVLALIKLIQDAIFKINDKQHRDTRGGEGAEEIGGNVNEYTVSELLNISDNLRRALRLVDHEGLRIAGDLRGSLYLGEQGQQIPLLVAD